MSKRKAAVNDIIYELDNDDIVISSDDESKEAKCVRLDDKNNQTLNLVDTTGLESCKVTVDTNKSSNCINERSSSSDCENGGKIIPTGIVTSEDIKIAEHKHADEEPDTSKKTNNDCSNTTIFNEDIVIDSPASNSDPGVVGCENRRPLVTVRFRDRKLAHNYMESIKTFILKLMKHDDNNLIISDTETDLELDIWPEDLNDEVIPDTNSDDNLFFVDTDPNIDDPVDIPRYSQGSSTVISNTPSTEESTSVPIRRGPTCFNCDGSHPLRDCTLPRNNSRIAEKRKNLSNPRVGRYHVEDDQKFGHLVPGRISGQLRHALGLKRHELPLHIYRMRELGYPPGWLEEARIYHSGITMFDSGGNAILDPEDEEGEVCEPGSKDKFDIKKIIDYPGFNVPASQRYKEEAHMLGLPPMSEDDSKLGMLQTLAPNAMKAYKRKKLTMFPSAAVASSSQETEMELDSGDEVAEFPSVPPLPDEPPPMVVPPPPPPPPPEEPPVDEPVSESSQKTDDLQNSIDDDIEVIEVMKVCEIPVPDSEWIVIDEDCDKSQLSSSRESPTLDDLEEKKRHLLNALEGDDSIVDITEINTPVESVAEENVDDESVVLVDQEPNDDDTASIPIVLIEETKEESCENNANVNGTVEIVVEKEVENIMNEKTDDNKSDINISSQPTTTTSHSNCVPKDAESEPQTLNTPDSKTGCVKSTLYGTPVMNIASTYVKLPSDDRFSKDICDVINFENLPNSTGKYKQICTLLKRVKSEVDRIQDS